MWSLELFLNRLVQLPWRTQRGTSGKADSAVVSLVPHCALCVCVRLTGWPISVLQWSSRIKYFYNVTREQEWSTQVKCFFHFTTLHFEILCKKCCHSKQRCNVFNRTLRVIVNISFSTLLWAWMEEEEWRGSSSDLSVLTQSSSSRMFFSRQLCGSNSQTGQV